MENQTIVEYFIHVFLMKMEGKITLIYWKKNLPRKHSQEMIICSGKADYARLTLTKPTTFRSPFTDFT